MLAVLVCQVVSSATAVMLARSLSSATTPVTVAAKTSLSAFTANTVIRTTGAFPTNLAKVCVCLQGRTQRGYKGIYTLPKFPISELFRLTVKNLETDLCKIKQHFQSLNMHNIINQYLYPPN